MMTVFIRFGNHLALMAFPEDQVSRFEVMQAVVGRILRKDFLCLWMMRLSVRITPLQY